MSKSKLSSDLLGSVIDGAGAEESIESQVLRAMRYSRRKGFGLGGAGVLMALSGEMVGKTYDDLSADTGMSWERVRKVSRSLRDLGLVAIAYDGKLGRLRLTEDGAEEVFELKGKGGVGNVKASRD